MSIGVEKGRTVWYNNKDLTTGDLTKLFDTELKMDYINGPAEITNKKT